MICDFKAFIFALDQDDVPSAMLDSGVNLDWESGNYSHFYFPLRLVPPFYSLLEEGEKGVVWLG